LPHSFWWSHIGWILSGNYDETNWPCVRDWEGYPEEVRTQMMETARPILEALVHEATSVKLLSLHHDISTVTGEKIVIFTLAGSPQVWETKKK
jgi:uncharacterized protein YbcI